MKNIDSPTTETMATENSAPVKTLPQLPGMDSLLLQKDGHLTQDLLLSPGKFGLGKVPDKHLPDSTTTMVCGYCSTGCGLNIHFKKDQVVNLTPTTDYPVNSGMACPKGWEAISVLDSPDRATVPLLKDRVGTQREVDWPTAITTFCDRMKKIQAEHGPDSVAFLGTGQIPLEELAILGAVAKFGMNIRHGDGNTRQCMASAVVAYKQSFGFDAPPYSYQDFEESDVIILVGSNLCIAHPILWQRICRNPHNPEIVTIDPRKTETAMASTLHLPIRPKSDLTLFYGIANLLIQNDWLDNSFIEQHTSEFESFKEHVSKYTPEIVVEKSGITLAELNRLTKLIAEGKRVSFWWTMGVNQSYEGVRTAQSLINLALMTGNIGRPGTGANSVTGQCNAMGSRLFSNTSNLLGGHDFLNAEHRQKVADSLNIDVEKIPDSNSWAYPEIMDGIMEDKIKALWVIATNTAHSWINQSVFKKIREKLDFLVVQDMYHTTETAEVADLVLPAAAWGEKEGTLINSERRIGLVKKVKRPPGQALSDFAILKLIAHYWGCEDVIQGWDNPEAVFNKLKALTKGQPCDISGIRDYRMIDEHGGIQWPLPEGTTEVIQERRLFADGKFYHADQRAKFIFEDSKPMPEPPSEKYPYLLLTGRGTVAQWHTQTRTGKSAVLRQLYPSNLYVEINPDDARAEAILPNQLVMVKSERGSVKANAFVTYSVPRGQVFLPMHYSETNQLTHPHFDPYSRQPSYKDCAVKLVPIPAKG